MERCPPSQDSSGVPSSSPSDCACPAEAVHGPTPVKAPDVEILPPPLHPKVSPSSGTSSDLAKLPTEGDSSDTKRRKLDLPEDRDLAELDAQHTRAANLPPELVVGQSTGPGSVTPFARAAASKPGRMPRRSTRSSHSSEPLVQLDSGNWPELLHTGAASDDSASSSDDSPLPAKSTSSNVGVFAGGARITTSIAVDAEDEIQQARAARKNGHQSGVAAARPAKYSGRRGPRTVIAKKLSEQMTSTLLSVDAGPSVDTKGGPAEDGVDETVQWEIDTIVRTELDEDRCSQGAAGQSVRKWLVRWRSSNDVVSTEETWLPIDSFVSPGDYEAGVNAKLVEFEIKRTGSKPVVDWVYPIAEVPEGSTDVMPDGYQVYHVKPGETNSVIADIFELDPQSIEELNASQFPGVGTDQPYRDHTVIRLRKAQHIDNPPAQASQKLSVAPAPRRVDIGLSRQPPPGGQTIAPTEVGYGSNTPVPGPKKSTPADWLRHDPDRSVDAPPYRPPARKRRRIESMSDTAESARKTSVFRRASRSSGAELWVLGSDGWPQFSAGEHDPGVVPDSRASTDSPPPEPPLEDPISSPPKPPAPTVARTPPAQACREMPPLPPSPSSDSGPDDDSDQCLVEKVIDYRPARPGNKLGKRPAEWKVQWVGKAASWEPIHCFVEGSEVTLEWEQFERQRTGKPPEVDWLYPDLAPGDSRVMADGYMVYCCYEDATMHDIAEFFNLSLGKLIRLNAKNPLFGKRTSIRANTTFRECTTLRLYQSQDGFKGPEIEPPYPESDPRVLKSPDTEPSTGMAPGSELNPNDYVGVGHEDDMDLLCGCASKKYGTCKNLLSKCRTHTKTQKKQVARSADFDTLYELSVKKTKLSKARESDEAPVTVLKVRRKQDGSDEYLVLQYKNGSKKRSWEPEWYLIDRDFPERGAALARFKKPKPLPTLDSHGSSSRQLDVARPRVIFDVSRNKRTDDHESNPAKRRQFASMSDTQQNRMQQSANNWMAGLDFNKKISRADADRFFGSLQETAGGTVSRSSWITSLAELKKRNRRIAELVENERVRFQRKLRAYTKDTTGSGEGEMKEFRPLQLEIIMTCLETTKDVIVHMPTGDGKSLPFQFLAWEKREMTMVVILPLKSLRDDQIDRIKHNEVYHQLDKVVHEGDACQIIFTTPEILQKSSKAQKLLGKLSEDKRISRLVLDEAHVISSASKHYRPVYTDLLKQRDSLFPNVPILAMSAVGSKQVIDDITASLGIREHVCFRGNFFRAQTNIAYHSWQKVTGTSTDHVLRLLDETHGCSTGSAIVYCLQKSDCKKVAESLSAAGISAKAFHSDVPDEDKELIRLAWQDGSIRVVCATDSFGLGINNPNVRMIIHFSPPLNMPMFYQQCGRAGRDGQLADCVLLYHRSDWGRARNVIAQNECEVAAREKKYKEFNEVIEYATQTGICRQKSILIAAGIEPGTIPKTFRCNRCDFCQFELHHARSARIDVTFAVNKLLAWLLSRASAAHGGERSFTLAALKKEFFGDNLLGCTLGFSNTEMEGLMEDLLLGLLARGSIKLADGNYSATSADSLPEKTEAVRIIGTHRKSVLNSYSPKPKHLDANCVGYRCRRTDCHSEDMNSHPIFGERFRVCNQCRAVVDKVSQARAQRSNCSAESTVEDEAHASDGTDSEMSVEFMEEEGRFGCCMCASTEFSVTCTACPSTFCRRCVKQHQGTDFAILQTGISAPGTTGPLPPRWFCPKCTEHHGVTMILPADEKRFVDAASLKSQFSETSVAVGDTSTLTNGTDPENPGLAEGQQSAGLVGPNLCWPFFIRVCAEIAVNNAKLEWAAFTQDMDDALCSESESLRSKMKKLRDFIGKGAYVAVPRGGMQQLEDPQTWGLHLRGKVVEEGEADLADQHNHRSSLIIQPGAPELKRQKRFWLKYGRDRFLSVSLSVAQYTHPRLRQLLFEPLLLFGRQWQLLVPRVKRMETELIFFAVSDDPCRVGPPELDPVSIAEVQDWHFPWRLNLDTTIAKYVSRFDLGFSDTTRTIEIEPKCFEKVADNLNADNVVMNDGCAGIHPDLMKQIGAKLVEDAQIDDTELCPSAIQVRLGSVKGVLYQDKTVKGVAASESMRKYELPLDDPIQRTIEVIKYSKRTAPAYLNRQGLRALEARGLTRETVEKKSQAARTNLLSCLSERTKLIKLLGQGGGRMETEVKEKIEAGFQQSSAFVRSDILKLIEARCERKKGESQFPIENARRALIIADPTLTLEPNECYIHLSSTGLLMNKKVVMFRNPCYHPGELLVLEAVNNKLNDWTQEVKERLNDMKDIVVLSAKGPQPTADKMQGGDYDGDEVMVIYDEDIVSEISEGWEPPAYRSIPAKANFVGNQTLRQLKLDTSRHALNEGIIDTFFAMIKESSKLGEASNLFECWADIAAGSWKKPDGEFTPAAKNAQALAEICFNQIDAEKTGSFMSIPPHLKSVEKPHYEKKAPGDKGKFRQSTSLVAVLDNETKDLQRRIAGMDAGHAQPDEDILSVNGRTNEQASIDVRYREIKEQIASIMGRFEDGEIEHTERDELINAVTEKDELEFSFVAGIDKKTQNARAAAWYVAMQEDYNKKRNVWLGMKQAAEKRGQLDEFDTPARRFPHWVYRICGDFIRNIKGEKYAERNGLHPIMAARRL